MKPWEYRSDRDVYDGIDWEDNWLSNSIAWFSFRTGLVNVADREDGWMSRVTNYFWTDCPICLFFRGIAVGVVCAITVGIVIISALI